MKFLQLLLICLTLSTAHAQKGMELGGWIGASQYYGDLNDGVKPQDPGLAAGFLARYNYNNRISIRGGLSYAQVGADDAESDNNFNRNRNLSFSSSIIDATGAFEFNFFPYTHGSTDEWFTPYLYGGLSIFRFNPKAELNGTTYELQPLGTEGQDLGGEYGRISAGLTIGGGLKWDINYDWSFNVELSYHSTRTDYLDDVSTTYPNFTSLGNQRGQTAVDLSNRALVDGIGVPGRQRGDSTSKDKYVFFSVGIMKYFGRLECPAISDF